MVFVFLGDLQGGENILLCLSKEHSTASISGYQDIFKELEITPNLERISGNGILFKNAFCSTANSELSLKSILTGTLVDPKQQKKRDQLQPANIQSILKKKGYSTVFFGNWKLVGFPKTRLCFKNNKTIFKTGKFKQMSANPPCLTKNNL